MKRILFCVLNWGLGHATRSVPIISSLLEYGCHVHIASDGQALSFLKRRFPELMVHNLVGYEARYPTKSLYLNMLSMAFRLQVAIEKERQQVHELTLGFHPDIIFSDNRYGCYHQSTQNILISHQLRLPVSNLFERRCTNYWLDKKLKPFSELWVPDHSPPDHLTGRMSELADRRVKYIGPISSMSIVSPNRRKDRLLILLSGPEPTRTKLENTLLGLKLYQYFSCQLIRGTSTPLEVLSDHVDVTDVATSKEVSEAIAQANIIICRSGYSTIMDLQKLNRKAIYIPTPAQPEQIYLANVISEKQKGIRLDERKLSIGAVLKAIDELMMLDEVNEIYEPIYRQYIREILIK